jgi:type IV pilus assembly protein PilY1
VLNNLLKKIASPSTLLLTMTAAMLTHADDTELYSVTYAAGDSGKPKVLILFDDSGSMNDLHPGIKPSYDPTATYKVSVPADRIYWSDPSQNGGSIPPPANSTQWFPVASNSCGESFTPLAEQGVFNATQAARWQSANGHWGTKKNCILLFLGVCWKYGPDLPDWIGDPAGWLPLAAGVNGGSQLYTVDCVNDANVNTKNDNNAKGIASGYPYQPTAVDSPDSAAYTTPWNNTNVPWPANPRRFYTSNYMNWYYDNSIVPAAKTSMQIAKDVITDLVKTNTAIDFGMALFNNNTNSRNDGGRIVQRIIKNMTNADRNGLITTLNKFTASGNTPLCETAWEAYLYLTGGTRLYGTPLPAEVPAKDDKAESGGKYISPLEKCANTYLIYMTDGEPTLDTAADAAIKAKTGVQTCPTYAFDKNDPTVTFTSCLPPLTKYMATNDLDGDSTNGVQVAPMATIGFNVGDGATQLLTDAATMTKTGPDGSTKIPAYYAATNAADLAQAFTDFTLGILSIDSTFTSPAVAVDSFSRTESRDDVFFAMFEPAATSDWLGNLKKLKLDTVNGALTFVDANGVPAINSDGAIQATAKTFWSLSTDGPTVTAGGVGELLKARTLSTRNILTNTGSGGALQTFNSTNINKTAYGFANDQTLWDLWQVSSAADLAASIDYGWGYDVEDQNNDGQRNDTRHWIMADILHSTPLTINYGARSGFTVADPDLRIVVGTNDGLLHMFNNSDGKESWAFFPKELGAALTKRRKNSGTPGQNVYGVDGAPVSYIIDANKDGTIRASDGDKAYVYFGLRRGGSLFYALDVTDPDNPVFLWSIDPTSVGLSELGQSWSTPVVATIPGYKDANGKPKKVLIFGGGYDPVKDSHATLATPSQDTFGRGLFIVDALTGKLVWSITPAANSATNMQATGLVHSIPAAVATLDSNGDSLTDRIYMADSGGNLWRVDLPGDTLPTSSENTWFIVKLFESVKTTVPDSRTKRTDRRFFNQPNIVKTTFNGAPVDVITIGTGDRTNPAATDNPTDTTDPTADDQFYAIFDAHTTVYQAALTADCVKTPPADFRCLLPLNPNDLYDNTTNKLQTGTAAEKAAAQAALNAAHGWRIDLTGNGEKNLSESRTLGGKVEFNTFTPGTVKPLDPNHPTCGTASGTAQRYVRDLFNGTPTQDCNGDGKTDNACITGSTIQELPTLIITSDGTISETQAPASGKNLDGEVDCVPCNTGTHLDGPYGNYWEREDF